MAIKSPLGVNQHTRRTIRRLMAPSLHNPNQTRTHARTLDINTNQYNRIQDLRRDCQGQGTGTATRRHIKSKTKDHRIMMQGGLRAVSSSRWEWLVMHK